MNLYFILAPSLALLLGVALWVLIKTNNKVAKVQEGSGEIDRLFAPVVSAEASLKEYTESYVKLQARYKKGFVQLKSLESKMASYNIGVGTTDSAIYEVSNSDASVSDLERELKKVKEEIKELVRCKKACICKMGKEVAVNGKKSEAKKLFNREIKLRIRCLDNEFKAAQALADWNNINRLIERAKKRYDQINASGEIVKTKIQPAYINAKIRELKLVYEIRKLKADIKEEEREIRRIEREAKREEARIQEAAKKAHKEREKMERLVELELSKLEKATSGQREQLKLHQQELKILKERENRAVSMAQITRAGYVYVISNKRSFGEGICKVGMTRRVDPKDRVKELGDASVPEYFDVHAFIYTEDAPKLEKFLHDRFSEFRMNLVNKRKEFFRMEVAPILESLDSYDEKLEIMDLQTK